MTSITGKFIVIEGLEGAGKSTAVETVVETLSQFNISSITTREPGGTPIGEILRSVIKNPDYKNELDDKSELLLLYAARIQLVEQVIKPTLKKGIWVIGDRFELSTFAYQGGGRGFDLDWIQQLSMFCLNGFQPDLVLYLDINPELGMERAKNRGQFDRIEQQSIDFFYKTHAAYLQQIKDKANALTINASLSLSQVKRAIQQAIAYFVEQN